MIAIRLIRSARPSVLVLTTLLATTAACDNNPAEPDPESEALECTSEEDAGLCVATLVTGLHFPLQLEQPPGDDRLFVAEMPGRIRIVRNDELLNQPFLDIVAEVQFAPERGLIGMAFHPQFATNGHVYISFTDPDGNTRVQRFTAETGADVLDISTREDILVVERESGKHNAGLVLFGPDGMLWIATGDMERPWEAQDPGSLHGAILRIDVDGGDPYTVPADNPFIEDPAARPEVWVKGLRNPWRFSFESSGRLFIADVGEGQREELNIVGVDEAGLNFGWPHLEGSLCYLTPNCDPSNYSMPAFEYDHDVGCSIIGGTIYGRSDIPALHGRYVLADYCGWVGSVAADGREASDFQILELGDIGMVHSLGSDAEGRLYVITADAVGRIQPVSE